MFSEYEDLIRSDIWNDQVDDVIEFYAAWRPYAPHTYQTDRAALMRLLAARKRCRDFQPARGRAGVPKSSLDGVRESVLRPPREWPGWSRRRLRLAEGEQLDVVGLIKRVWKPASGPVHYPSVARVAADPWLCKVSNSPHFNEFLQACLARRDVVHEIDTSGPWGNPHYALFPFEGSVVYRSRYREFCREVEVSDSDLKPLAQALEKLTADFGEPSPYLGVLVADGDHMGEALSKLESPDDHKRFSQALASFAAKANDIIKNHNGVLVYSGGDDVLAFVPVDRCLECARALYDSFSSELAHWSSKTAKDLTLSVGLAIAHFMEPLEDLLRYGGGAEQHAKRLRSENLGQQNRNGLAVHLVKRGGGELAVRNNWSVGPDKHLTHLAELLKAEAISSRVAYDMHKVAAVYDSWPEAVKLESLGDLKSTAAGCSHIPLASSTSHSQPVSALVAGAPKR